VSARLGNLLGHSAIYMAANFLQRGLSFLLIPLYAAYFSTAEFGAMDMLYQLAITLALLTSFGLPQGLVRGFYLTGKSKDKDSASTQIQLEDRRKLLGALITFLVPISLVCTGGLVLFSESLSHTLFKSEGQAQWIWLTALLYLALAIQGLPLQLFKTEQQSRAFAAWSLAAFGLVASGNLYFIMVSKLGLQGMLLGNLLGVGGTALVLFFLMLPKVQLNWDWKLLTPLFAFGLPMLPNLLSRKVLEVGNRYMIPHWHGLSEVGIFSMGARVASIMDILLLVPFLYAWQPFFYSLAGKVEAPKIFASVTHYFILLLSCIFLGMQVFQSAILHFLGRGKYDEAGPVVSLLLVAAIFNGIQYCVSAGIHLRKKLVTEMFLMLGVAIVNILLNLVLIPKFGAEGAAAATATAFGLFLIGSFFIAQRVFPVPYLWRRSSMICIWAIGAYVALLFVHSLSARITIIAVFSLLGPIWDLKRNGELATAWQFASHKLGWIRPGT
jgi:O-antigen/teichoic acid export membrane protein